jgi:hypothetical protein
MVLTGALFGLLGGIARAAVGLTKAMRQDVEIVWKYAIITIISSGVIGMAAGILFDSDPKISVVAGYIGMDLLENSYKIIFRKNMV